MTRRTVRPERVAGGAVVVGGLLVILFPGHGLTVLRLVIVTIAAGAAIHVLALSAPRAWWTSPFDRGAGSRPETGGSMELEALRAALSGRRQPVDGGPPLPAETLRLLQPLVETAAERGGLDPHGAAHGAKLTRLTRAVYGAEPLMWARWHRTRRADPGRVADAVHRVLDDLDRLAGPAGGHPPRPHEGA